MARQNPQDKRGRKGPPSKSSAIAYAVKLEQLAHEKKQLEKEVRDGIDRVSGDIGQLVAAEIEVGAAPELLGKSRELADAKDYVAAKAFLERARSAITGTSLPKVEARISTAQERVNAIERLGVVEVDLGELATQFNQARRMLRDDDMLGALEMAESAAKRAIEAAKTELGKLLTDAESLLKDAEKEGLDISRSRKSLDEARASFEANDYQKGVDSMIKFQTNLERARKGVTGEVAEEAPVPTADALTQQDRALLVEGIRRSLEAVDGDLRVLEEIKGLVSHPENLAGKAKKALEEGNLPQARRLAREAHLATIRALRERLRDVINTGRERMKKARREGLNIHEVKAIYTDAVANLDSYMWKDSYQLALSIDDRINQLREDKIDIERVMKETTEEISRLAELGTNEARVQEHMEAAKNAVERGDLKKARVSIAKAITTARTSTQAFIDSYINEVRNVLLSVRTVGGNISTARPLLITAKKDMNKKEFREAVERVRDSVKTIKGVDQEYLDALQVVMDSYLRYTLAESMNLNVAEMGESLKNAMVELNQKQFDRAIKLAQKADFDVEIAIEDFKATSEDMAKARMSIEEARKVGADVSEADFLFTKADTAMQKTSFEVAQELFADAVTTAEEARTKRVGDLIKDAKETIEEEERKGINIGEGKRLLEDAEEAYRRKDYTTTIDLLNEAIEVMFELSKRQEMAQKQLQVAEELLSESKRYAEENPLADDFIKTAHELYGSGQYEQSYDVARQVVVDVESGLVRYIDVIMDDTKNEIARAEEHGAVVSQARDYYKLARRHYEASEFSKALTLSRKASMLARETLNVFQEVMEGRDLLDGYIQWAKRVSKHLRMPEEELEQTRALVQQKKYPEAQQMLRTALDSAKQTQITFVKAELESVDAFLSELEEGGVGTDVARNTLEQAHHSLEANLFEQSFNLASQSRQQGLENQSLYKYIIENLQQAKTAIANYESLGVDVRSLSDHIDKTEKALINQTYTFARDFVDQLLMELPKVTQVFINRRFNEARSELDEARGSGIIATAQEGLLEKARSVAEAGDLAATVTTLDHLRDELVDLRNRQGEARHALVHLAEVLEAAGEIGVDATAPRALEVKAKQALVDNRFEDVHKLVSNAEDVLLKTSSTFIVDYINRVQATLVRLERMGARVAPIEDRIDQAWNHLDDRQFTEAFAAARECTLALQRVEERFPPTFDRIRAAEAQIGRVAFLDVDVDGPTAALASAHEALAGLDFDTVERQISDALDDLAGVLRNAAETQVIELDGLITDTEAKGADVAPARERLERARFLVDQGEPSAGFLMAISGVEAVARAKREMADALEDRARAEEIFKDAEDLGADVERSKEILAEIDDSLRLRRYVDAISGVRRLELETGKAKHSHVLALIGQADNALIEVEELGLSSKGLRGELATSETGLEARDFHAAAATARTVIETARDIKHRYITARDRIVAVQSQIYDASGIGANTSRATDLLGEARDALSEQRLDEALELAESSASELTARLADMVSYEEEALIELHDEAGKQGMVVEPLRVALTEAQALVGTQDLKAAVLRLRAGLDEGQALLAKYRVAAEALGACEQLLETMGKLSVDSGVPSAETDRVRRAIREQQYDEAKAHADTTAADMRRALDEHMASRTQGLLALFDEARGANIRIADIDERYQVARANVASDDYLAVEAVINTHEADANVRMAAYKDALGRIELTAVLLQDAEGLRVDVETVHPVMSSARELLGQGRYPEAGTKADEAKALILELEKQFVLKYIKDAEDLIEELKGLGIDTVEATDSIERARAALEIEEYPGAHTEAVNAITTCQTVKAQYTEAKGLIEQAIEGAAKAERLGVDPAEPNETIASAKEALEFQSYGEAKELAIKARELAATLMRDHIVTALGSLRTDVAAAADDGVELHKAEQLLALAQGHVDGEEFFPAQEVIEATQSYLAQRKAIHERAAMVHERVMVEVENSGTIGVEMAPYKADIESHGRAHADRDYATSIRTGMDLLKRLAEDQRAMMDIYIGEVMDLVDAHVDGGVKPEASLGTLHESLTRFFATDYAMAHSLANEAREELQMDGSVLEDARNAVQDCRRIVIWAEGVGVAVDDPRVELERAAGLLDTGRAKEALKVANASYEHTLEAIGTSARDALTRAETRAEEVRSHGADPSTTIDRVSRGRRSLENDDFGYALLFGHLAIAEANRAEKDLEEARVSLDSLRGLVELARKVLDDPTEAEALEAHVHRCVEEKHAREAVRQARSATSAIRSSLNVASQRRIESVEDSLAVMEHMGLDNGPLTRRLADASDALENADFLEATTVATEVARVARTEMETAARSALTECEDAVDILGRVGAEAPDVVEALAQARSFEDAEDHYHALELARRTTERASALSDQFILEKVSSVRALLDGARTLGVEVGELERLLEKADRKRSQGHFGEAKEGLDELSEAIDRAQRELVDALVTTCDRLKSISAERSLDSKVADSKLEEAHHHLSMRGYQHALESARMSFDGYAVVFTALVRGTLEDAKRLLIELDVSADIEDTSEHYIKAEESLQRHDYISALEHADETMAHARRVQMSVIESILAEAAKEIERGEALGADMSSAKDIASEARTQLEAMGLAEGQVMAARARDEARALQAAYAKICIQNARMALDTLPFEVDVADLREMVEAASGGLDGGEFEAAVDGARSAEQGLAERLELHVKASIQAAEKELKRGQSVGIDLEGPTELIEEARMHHDAQRWLEGEQAAQKCIALVDDLVTRHKEAQQALGELMELIERATRARSKLSEAMDMQEAAEDAMEEHDYKRVLELATMAMEDAKRAFETRVQEAVSTAEGKLKYLQGIHAPAKLAEDLLTMSRDAMGQNDLDGAYDYADQAIKEADAAKTSFRDIIDITFQAESLIGTARQFGMDVTEAKNKLDDALETKNVDVNRALALAKESQDIAAALVESFVPDLSVAVEFESALVKGKWTNANLEVRNSGSARALRVAITLSGNLDVDGLGDINLLRGGGQTKKVSVRIKPSKSGEIMARVHARCEREYDDRAFEFHDVRWLLAEEEAGEDAEPGPQFVRKELTCTICQGVIGVHEAPRACSCGATFHQGCVEQLEKCPNCSKSLGG